MNDYRLAALRCPSCSSLLDEIQAGEALVDVCRQCHGIFLDWFDGAPRSVASALVAPQDNVWIGPEPKPLEGMCPRCAVRLEVELFEGRGPYVHRCGACSGVFVDATSVGLLASTAVPDPAKDPAGPVARLLRALEAAVRSLTT